MSNEDDFVDLGKTCADVCEALDRGLKGKGSDEVGESVHKAIEKLTTSPRSHALVAFVGGVKVRRSVP